MQLGAVAEAWRRKASKIPRSTLEACHTGMSALAAMRAMSRKIPIRGGDVEGVNRFEVHCGDDLAGVLEVRGDEDAGLFLEVAIFAEIGFGEGIFEYYVKPVEAAG